MDELQRWLDDYWDPDLTVGEWWERLGMSGWAAPLLPVEAYGRGMSRGDARPSCSRRSPSTERSARRSASG